MVLTLTLVMPRLCHSYTTSAKDSEPSICVHRVSSQAVIRCACPVFAPATTGHIADASHIVITAHCVTLAISRNTVGPPTAGFLICPIDQTEYGS